MIKCTLNEILVKVDKYKKIVLVGAGYAGKDLLLFLQNNEKNIECLCDNDETLFGAKINGVKIESVSKREGKCLYIITVKKMEIVEELRKQLLSLDINDEDIITPIYYERTYEYMSSLKEDEYKTELDKMYYETFNKRLNWSRPQTYNEKINCQKLSNDTEEKTKLVDKLLVREWIKEKIGKDYLTKIHGVWDKAEDIDFDALPNQFVLKMNNGSGRNIIVTDKTRINESEIIIQLNEWKKKNFAYVGLELQYKNIVPKIICEEYLEGVAENLYDYDIYCFHGEPEYILCINGCHRRNSKASFYNKEWEKQEFCHAYPIDEKLAPRPQALDKMIELSRILSKDFEHARIDWYEYPKSKHGILFSEITFSTWSGFKHFVPDKWDLILGNLI